ncbi:MAG: tRNA pseudouridine(38-40) synthase TruA [Candidatus Izemoplasmatales bacterium]|nr:tRNA pseudouridine(38-40) synthase TruA [Candidatus Izemoplasmatales bacterium]
MLERLHPSVALKVDDVIILDHDEVIKYLSTNPTLIEGVNFTDHRFFHMDYGYNSLNNPIKISYKDDLIQRIIIKTKNYSEKRLKLVISYDGSNYHGWQIQDKLPTIQGILSEKISEVNNKPILIQGASRTDAKVHANQQVVHFDDESNLTEAEWLRYLNHQLPEDILVESVEKMHPLFHSRYDVYEKEYLYQIKLGDKSPFLINYSWNQEYLDFIKLDDQLKKIVGTYDFTSFAKGNKGDNVRTIYRAGYKIHDDMLKIYISGNGFLRYMVRLIIMHVIKYATNKTDVDILNIIREKSRIHTKEIAPAQGLYLNKIIY